MPPDPCTTLATHRWDAGTSLMLTLPDCDTRYDVVRTWTCQRCGLPVWAVGTVDHTTPPISPAQWDDAATWQQGPDGDVYGQAVARQEAMVRGAMRVLGYSLGQRRRVR